MDVKVKSREGWNSLGFVPPLELTNFGPHFRGGCVLFQAKLCRVKACNSSTNADGKAVGFFNMAFMHEAVFCP